MAHWRAGAIASALAACFVAGGGGITSDAYAQEVTSGSDRAPDGSTVVMQHIEVPATIVEVWSYDPDAKSGDASNIRSRYLAFVPHGMIALQAIAAPPDFPYPEVLDDLHSVFEFAEVGERRTGASSLVRGL